MLTRCPFALWRGEIPNRTPGGFMPPIVGVVAHIMGSSYTAADGWFHNPRAQASAQFGICNGGSGGMADGQLVQWTDLADRAWHAVAANRHWVGVETEGLGGPMTEAQVVKFAQLFAWLRQPDVFGPDLQLQITDDPSNGHGLGYHQMGGAAWGGHACPGPQRVVQRQRIIDLAHGQPPTPQPVQEDDDMAYLLKAAGHDEIFLVDGLHKLHILSTTTAAKYIAAGFKFVDGVDQRDIDDMQNA